jgi:hypothetical protein
LLALKISQISGNMRNTEITGKIVRKGDIREVETRYGPERSRGQSLGTKPVQIRLNLWRQQIDEINIDDAVRLINAFAIVYFGEMQLIIGSDGWIEVLERGSLWK